MCVSARWSPIVQGGLLPSFAAFFRPRHAPGGAKAGKGLPPLYLGPI